MESQAHITPLTLAPDRRQSETALAIARGTARLRVSITGNVDMSQITALFEAIAQQEAS